VDRIIGALESGTDSAASDADDDDQDELDDGRTDSPQQVASAEQGPLVAASDSEVPDNNHEESEYEADVPSQPAIEPASAGTASHGTVSQGHSRRFEFKEGNSSKFWEIAVSGDEHTVRFGRIGSNGQSQTKSFPTAAAASKDAARLIAEKTRKGYRETS
jgi:predicted DNA-binding WGR domain protein